MNHCIDLYNTKLILSFLKQTLTLGAVTPTLINTSEEADGAKEAMAAKAATVAEIAGMAQSLNPCLKEK